MSDEKTIDDWRIRIDEIDQQLVALFSERAQCCIEIGHIKQRLGMDVYSPKREAQVIANVTGANRGPLDDDAIKRLFERIIDESRRIERIESGGAQEKEINAQAIVENLTDSE
ncbi:MAG TPA: chorismate mutase [Blastocatellia bacterium]|nr:chorismate mutase [Blastocatellia bacterium]